MAQLNRPGIRDPERDTAGNIIDRGTTGCNLWFAVLFAFLLFLVAAPARILWWLLGLMPNGFEPWSRTFGGFLLDVAISIPIYMLVVLLVRQARGKRE